MICLFKCPGCGDDMHFDIDTQMLLCDVCGCTMPPSEYDLSRIQMNGNTQYENELTRYHCPSCGAILIRSKEQVTCECAYCGTDLAVFDHGEGKYTPEKIIAFKLTKEEARDQFACWWVKHSNLPEFKSEKMHLEIRSVYIPIWLVDADVHTTMTAILEKQSLLDYSKPKDEYTKLYYARMKQEKCDRSNYSSISTIDRQVEYYGAKRKIAAEYKGIPSVASLNFSASRFHAVEPYNYTELEDFTPAYISGFMAEQYSLEPDVVIPRSLKRIAEYGKEQCIRHILASVGGDVKIKNTTQFDQQTQLKEIEYGLVPLWVCSYRYQGQRQMVYVNGQTGKTDGTIIDDPNRKKKEIILHLLSYFVFFLPSIVLMISFTDMETRKNYSMLPFLLAAAPSLVGYVTSQGNLFKIGKDSGRDYVEKIDYQKKTLLPMQWMVFMRVVLGSIGSFFVLEYISFMNRNEINNFTEKLPWGIVFTALIALLYTALYMKRSRDIRNQKDEVEYSDYLEPCSTKVIMEENENSASKLLPS